MPDRSMPALPHGSTNTCACKAYQVQQTAELAFDKTLRLKQTLEEDIADLDGGGKSGSALLLYYPHSFATEKIPDTGMKFPDFQNIFPVNFRRDCARSDCGTAASCCQISS